jgi:hypothetical protein
MASPGRIGGKASRHEAASTGFIDRRSHCCHGWRGPRLAGRYRSGFHNIAPTRSAEAPGMPPRAAPRAAARRSLIASGEVARAAALVVPAGSAIHAAVDAARPRRRQSGAALHGVGAEPVQGFLVGLIEAHRKHSGTGTLLERLVRRKRVDLCPTPLDPLSIGPDPPHGIGASINIIPGRRWPWPVIAPAPAPARGLQRRFLCDHWSIWPPPRRRFYYRFQLRPRTIGIRDTRCCPEASAGTCRRTMATITERYSTVMVGRSGPTGGQS